MPDAVKDTDLGFRDMARAAAKIDGLELRTGILDHTLQYPKSADAEGQYISKVAMINEVYRAISSGYDSRRTAIDAGMQQLLVDVHKGRGRPGARIYVLIGQPLRDAMRSSLSGLVRRRSGRMWNAIRATVFADGRVGTRRSAASGRVVAGDKPKFPKAGDSI